MKYRTLREAVENTLGGIDMKQMVEGAVPELDALDSWTNKTLAAILCDKNNLTFKDQALLSLFTQLQHPNTGADPSESSPISSSLDDHERKKLEDCIAKAELPYMSRDFSAGVLVPHLTSNANDYIAVDGPSILDSSLSSHSSNSYNMVMENEAPMEFLPLVGISIGHQPGPLKSTLDSIFLSGLHRSRSRNDVCTTFFRHILRLWKLVIHTWFNPPQPNDGHGQEDGPVRTRQPSNDQFSMLTSRQFMLEDVDPTRDKVCAICHQAFGSGLTSGYRERREQEVRNRKPLNQLKEEHPHRSAPRM